MKRTSYILNWLQISFSEWIMRLYWIYKVIIGCIFQLILSYILKSNFLMKMGLGDEYNRWTIKSK